MPRQDAQLGALQVALHAHRQALPRGHLPLHRGATGSLGQSLGVSQVGSVVLHLRTPRQRSKGHGRVAVVQLLIGAKHLCKGLLQQWHVHLAIRQIGKEDFLPGFILLSRDAGKIVVHLDLFPTLTVLPVKELKLILAICSGLLGAEDLVLEVVGKLRHSRDGGDQPGITQLSLTRISGLCLVEEDWTGGQGQCSDPLTVFSFKALPQALHGMRKLRILPSLRHRPIETLIGIKGVNFHDLAIVHPDG
mmetsp:Transcript_68722/g.108275  ORF Transcript_68722/g.108275 Transcript_68722/m.108275 type:complete len:248 (-) Transcript_68722:578-1321(-)